MRRPLPEVAGHAAISLAIVAASVWVIVSLLNRSLRSRLPVSLYLWGMLLIYPLYNVFRAVQTGSQQIAARDVRRRTRVQ
jgi:drug/metabolite transporter (DMT)-like permease